MIAQRGDRLVEGVEVRQHLADQESVMGEYRLALPTAPSARQSAIGRHAPALLSPVTLPSILNPR